MTTAVGLVQVAPKSTCEQAVAPRKRARTRARGATETKSPAALAAGNGRNAATAEAVVQAASEAPAAEPVRKPRRRFYRVTMGGITEIDNGYIHRWVKVPDEWDRPKMARLIDEHGLPASEWEETGRFSADSRVTIEFPEGFEPSLVWLDRHGKPKWGPPKGTKPQPAGQLEWFPARDREKRLAFIAGLPEQDSATKPKKPRSRPEEPPEEQWFQITLPPVAMQNGYWGQEHEWGSDRDIPPDARENFPEGWCCRLAQPQPADGDPDWLYVQFPEPYIVHDSEGRPTYKTDRRGGGGKVKCGMWVPRWVLKPINTKEAVRLWDTLKIYTIYGYTSFEEAEKYYEYLIASGNLKKFFRIAPKVKAIQSYFRTSFNEAFYIYLGEASASDLN